MCGNNDIYTYILSEIEISQSEQSIEKNTCNL